MDAMTWYPIRFPIDFGFSGFQSSNDVHIDYEYLSHLKCQPKRAAEFWRVVRDLFDRLGLSPGVFDASIKMQSFSALGVF